MLVNFLNTILLIFSGFLFLFIGIQDANSQERKVAVTFDDLPIHGDLKFAAYVNKTLIDTLQDNDIPAIGFVNEAKLYRDEKPDSTLLGLLRLWLESGMELGNHTYSHIFINQTTVDEYKKDVIRGEKLTRPLLNSFGKELTYFRYTQLRTGPTDEYREELASFLDERGYTVAPVTIDNDEYIYAYCYEKAKENGEQELMKKIGADYLAYMENTFEYFEKLSVDFFGYEPNQTLLLHANLLNADYFGELANMLKNRGYQFVSIDEALEDAAYELPEGTHQRGPSWIHRWMSYQGKEIPEQPGISNFISNLFREYQDAN